MIASLASLPNYHTNQTKPGHDQIEQSQPIRIPETDIESKDNNNWKSNQEIRERGKYNITYTTEDIKNNRKGSTEKYGKNIRVQHFEERIEQVMAEDTRSIRTRAKLQEHDDVRKEVSNSQLQKKHG